LDIEASPRNSDCNCLPRASCSVRCFSARATILIPSLGFLLAEARFRFDFFKRNSPSWKVNVLVDLGLRANQPKLPLQVSQDMALDPQGEKYPQGSGAETLIRQLNGRATPEMRDLSR
jgi:hypothetical protein